MLNSLGVTEEIQEKEPVLPLDQNSNRSSHRSIPLSTQYRIYNPNPYIVYSDYPNLDENTLAKVETTESTGSFAFKLLSRLAGLWFVTVAAGSVICSIPISAMGLPIILGVGIFCLVAIAIFKYIVRIWVHLLSLSWRLTKTVIMSPKHLIGVGFSLVRKVTHLIFHRNTPGLIDQHPYPTFPPLVRRQSTTSSKYTDRSFEGF
jgi:hypothetical protein